MIVFLNAVIKEIVYIIKNNYTHSITFYLFIFLHRGRDSEYNLHVDSPILRGDYYFSPFTVFPFSF